MNRETWVRVNRRDFLQDGVEIRLAEITWHDGERSVAVARPLELEKIDVTVCGPDRPAAIVLDEKAAQQLIDQLWNAGVRPTEAAGSVGQLGAVKYHLEDMRRLVFEPPKETVEYHGVTGMSAAEMEHMLLKQRQEKERRTRNTKP